MDPKTMIISKLAQMECASLDVKEVARCFSGCCSPNKLTRDAMLLIEEGRLTIEDIRGVH